MKKACRHCGREFQVIHSAEVMCSSTCRTERRKQQSRIWYEERPDYSKNGNFRRKYNLTKEDVDRKLKEQENRCDICLEEVGFSDSGLNNARVDHDHKTGATRGILCHGCNIMLGHSKDNIEILKNAITYLEKHEA